MRGSRTWIVAILALTMLVGGVALRGWIDGPKPVSAETMGDDHRTISVTGVGEITVDPDICRLVLGVQTEGKTAAEAQAAAAKATNAVIAKLRALGIADKDIKTVSFNVYPVYDQGDRENPAVLQPIGFRVAHRLQITVRDLTKVARVIDDCIAAGANTADEITYAVEETEALRTQALTLAVKQARSKGDAIAKAAGVNIVEIKTIQEGYVDYGYYRAPVAYDKAMGAGESMIVMPGELVIRASVSMTLRF